MGVAVGIIVFLFLPVRYESLFRCDTGGDPLAACPALYSSQVNRPFVFFADELISGDVEFHQDTTINLIRNLAISSILAVAATATKSIYSKRESVI